MAAYYSEIDPFAAAWLRELIKGGLIADGEVDTRSIEDITPSDLRGFTQCHFFAGIGVWSYALRQAGWADEASIWTGSCPCQPFSSAGKGAGFADERHLWPAFHWLISQCKPDIVLGEQVASKDGLAWFDLVCADLEASGYAVGAVDSCAAGFGAPHIRQRLYWVANAAGQGRQRGRTVWSARPGHKGAAFERGGQAGRMADAELLRCDTRDPGDAGTAEGTGGARRNEHVGYCGAGGVDNTLCHGRGARGHNDGADVGQQLDANDLDCRVADAQSARWGERRTDPVRSGKRSNPERLGQRFGGGGIFTNTQPARPTDGHWRDADWLFCRDGKWRPVEPGTFPLAHGAPNRVGRLRGYGNAINAIQAQAFIEAVMGTI